MKLLHYKKYLWLLLLIPLFTVSCKKRKEQLIIGKWRMETYTLDPPDHPTYWAFDGDGVVTTYNDRTGTDQDTATGTYKVVMKSLVLTHLEITNPHAFRGLWRVEKLNKKILVLMRVGWLDKNDKTNYYLRREFVNVNYQ
jgi:hypothetical protein